MKPGAASWFVAVAVLCAPASCKPRTKAEPERAQAPTAARVAASTHPGATATAAERPAKKPPLRRQDYAWLDDSSLEVPDAVDTLENRFPVPTGFKRVKVEPKGFGAWLRTLPLAPEETPVRTYRGRVLMPASHESIAGVVALDIGKADLQQCADAIMRLHAEWQWTRGERNMSYRSASGTPMPLARWARGERPVPKGMTIQWEPKGRASSNDDHRSFRRYLDQVFAWANTVSLSKQARPVEPNAIRPGDFFILPGNPGHAVLVLDIAKNPDGLRVALLGQSFMPAQSFQVLHPGGESPWFELEATRATKTPFWEPFPWSSLRRLD